LEIVYERYCAAAGISRTQLYCTLVWLRKAPEFRSLRSILPRSLQRQQIGNHRLRKMVLGCIERLSKDMGEVSPGKFVKFPPRLPADGLLFGDKAYIGLAKVLPPIKRNNRRFSQRERDTFNKAMGKFRSRVEHSIKMLKSWKCLGGRWRSADTTLLKRCAIVVANLRNIYCEVYAPYPEEPEA
jgi:hypothetical protein